IKSVPFSTDKDIAVCVHIERPVHWPIRDNNRRLPTGSAVRGALKLHPAAAAINAIVCLVLKTVTRSAGFIDREPFLVAAAAASLTREQRPGLAAVCGAPQVVAKKG